jgi:hypothetical protein
MVHKDLQKFHNKKKNVYPNNVVNKKEVSDDKHPSDLPNFNRNDTKAFPNLSKTILTIILKTLNQTQAQTQIQLTSLKKIY